MALGISEEDPLKRDYISPLPDVQHSRFCTACILLLAEVLDNHADDGVHEGKGADTEVEAKNDEQPRRWESSMNGTQHRRL